MNQVEEQLTQLLNIICSPNFVTNFETVHDEILEKESYDSFKSVKEILENIKLVSQTVQNNITGFDQNDKNQSSLLSSAKDLLKIASNLNILSPPGSTPTNPSTFSDLELLLDSLDSKLSRLARLLPSTSGK